MSGYYSSVLRHVSNLRPDTFIRSFSSSGRLLSLGMGGAGSGLLAMGTHPMAAALAKGSHAATEAMLCGGMLRCRERTLHAHYLGQSGPTWSTVITSRFCCTEYHKHFGERPAPPIASPRLSAVSLLLAAMRRSMQTEEQRSRVHLHFINL